MRYFFVFTFTLATQASIGAQPVYQENYNQLITVGDNIFATEIANTPEKMQRGMMFRSSMADDQAMLFVFPRPQGVVFWMKNTLIPLDMLFFDANGYLLEIKSNVPPCKSRPCQHYASQHHNIRYVVELKAGTAEKQQITVGDRLNANTEAKR